VPFAFEAFVQVLPDTTMPTEPDSQIPPQLALGGGPSFARLKVSRMLVVGKLTGALGEAEDDGERDALGLIEGDTDELGETLGEVDDEGEMLLLGETLGLGLTEGETELEGERLGDGLILGLVLDEGLTEGDGETLALGLIDALGLLVLKVSVSVRMRLGLFAVVTPSEIARSVAESEPILIEPL